MISFGEKLLGLRKQKGLSQDELGGFINVSRQTISKWELNETTPELEKLVLLSSFFEVSLDDLIKGSSSQQNSSKARLSSESKTIIKRAMIFLAIIIGVVVVIDVVSMIIYFVINGAPT